MPSLAAHLERVAKELAREWIKKHRGDDKSICVCGAVNCGEFVEADLAGTVAAALAACAREARNEGIEAVCELVAARGDELFFGPFSIGHNPKRVQQEHTMLVELIRALKRERAVGEKA